MNNKRVNFFIFTLFLLIAIINIPLAKAATTSSDTYGGALWESITGISLSIGDFRENETFITFLFFLLIFLVIYSLSELFPFNFKDKPIIRFIFSSVVSLLAVLFVSKEQFIAIAFSYSAMGIAITTIIPFVSIAVISKNLGTEGHNTWAKIIWIALGVGMIFLLLTAPKDTLGRSIAWAAWFYGVTAIISFFVAGGWNWVSRKFRRMEAKEHLEEARNVQLADLEAEETRLLGLLKNLPVKSSRRLSLERQLNDIRAQMKDFERRKL